MNYRLLVFLVVTALVFGATSFSVAQPDVEHCEVLWPLDEDVNAVMYNLPNGTGRSIVDIICSNGSNLWNCDASFYVSVQDAFQDPSEMIPPEDIWVHLPPLPPLPSWAACSSGTIADHATDMNGMTTFSNAFFAGGWAQESFYVYISGEPIVHHPFPLHQNSADINGDLTVNLTDLQLFTADYYSRGYHFRSDLYYDGELNLADVPPIAAAYGASCP